MSKRPGGSELRREIARRFREAIGKKQLSQTQAAELLGVKRQTLWLYLNQKATPGGDVLRRACELWGISLTVNGFEFTAGAFGPTPNKSVSQTEQLELFRALEVLYDAKLEAKVVGKRGKYFEVKVLIRAPKEPRSPQRARRLSERSGLKG
jgi:transcriptional regulator with XRE-family HTH domain